MPQYRLEWQKTEQIEGAIITINCAKDIIVNCTEKNPDKIAGKEAKEIFDKLPEFSATLKKIVVHFQKEFT